MLSCVALPLLDPPIFAAQSAAAIGEVRVGETVTGRLPDGPHRILGYDAAGIVKERYLKPFSVQKFMCYLLFSSSIMVGPNGV